VSSLLSFVVLYKIYSTEPEITHRTRNAAGVFFYVFVFVHVVDNKESRTITVTGDSFSFKRPALTVQKAAVAH
jgi:hypothetical protein